MFWWPKLKDGDQNSQTAKARWYSSRQPILSHRQRLSTFKWSCLQPSSFPLSNTTDLGRYYNRRIWKFRTCSVERWVTFPFHYHSILRSLFAIFSVAGDRTRCRKKRSTVGLYSKYFKEIFTTRYSCSKVRNRFH